MTDRNLAEVPYIKKQLEEADKAAVLLEQAARNVRELGELALVDAAVYRGAAVLAASAAQELSVTAGMLEALEVLT